jgi:hypothetical protein
MSCSRANAISLLHAGHPSPLTPLLHCTRPRHRHLRVPITREGPAYTSSSAMTEDGDRFGIGEPSVVMTSLVSGFVLPMQVSGLTCYVAAALAILGSQVLCTSSEGANAQMHLPVFLLGRFSLSNQPKGLHTRNPHRRSCVVGQSLNTL